jgi:hypothetical protein
MCAVVRKVATLGIVTLQRGVGGGWTDFQEVLITYWFRFIIVLVEHHTRLKKGLSATYALNASNAFADVYQSMVFASDRPLGSRTDNAYHLDVVIAMKDGTGMTCEPAA